MKRVYRSEKPETFVEFDPRTGELTEGRIDEGIRVDWDSVCDHWVVSPSLPGLDRSFPSVDAAWEASKKALAALEPVPPNLAQKARFANSLASIVDRDLGISLRADAAFDFASMIVEKVLDTEDEDT